MAMALTRASGNGLVAGAAKIPPSPKLESSEAAGGGGVAPDPDDPPPHADMATNAPRATVQSAPRVSAHRMRRIEFMADLPQCVRSHFEAVDRLEHSGSQPTPPREHLQSPPGCLA